MSGSFQPLIYQKYTKMAPYMTAFLRSSGKNLASESFRLLCFFLQQNIAFGILLSKLLLSLFFLSLSPSGEAFAAPPTVLGNVATSDNTSIADRIETLEKSLSMLQKYTYNLSTATTTTKDGDSSMHGASPGVNNIDEITEHLKRIHSDMEKLQQDIARINERISQISSDFEQRISNIENPIKEEKEARRMVSNMESELEEVYSPRQMQQNSTPQSGDPNQIAVNSVEDDFRIAYGYLKSKNYTQAQEAFESFIKKYPRNTIVGDARYWLGEIYAVNGSYDRAAVEYLKGYQANPAGNRAADNLLRLSEMLIKLDKRQEACSTLTKMSKEFPKLQPSLKRQVDKVMSGISCVK